MPERFLQDRVELLPGDCRAQIATLADNSIDAVVTDPPYSLVSIGDRFGKPNSKLPCGGNNPHQQYNRIARGFMGQAWDTGEVAFDPAFWAEVLRVLKPGGHVLAMGGTRTYHRLACAIEDAGFEIRDCVMWVYGSGFPKSHDVSKGIDKLDAVPARLSRQFRFTEWMRSTGLTASQIDALTDTFMGSHYTTHSSQPAVATRDIFEVLRPHFGCSVPEWVEDLVDERTVESENFKRREVLAVMDGTRLAVAPGQGEERGGKELALTASFTDAARQWSGWGSALKPAAELVCLARKPLSEGTIAANVLKHGTGALNIDGTRIGARVANKTTSTGEVVSQNVAMSGGNYGRVETGEQTIGRWPANMILDGSEEVVAAFPDAPGQQRATGPEFERNANVYGKFAGVTPSDPRGDSGSAARFFKQCEFTEDDKQWADGHQYKNERAMVCDSRLFYSAKADSDDRLGSRHPTVKPLDLMQYLIRLICPPRGVVLDPFAGTGTTGEAAYREGMRAVLIEREETYQADIRRRMALVLSGPDERTWASVKEKQKGKPVDHGPLFAGTDLEEAAE